jgi:hypothetical protein
MIFWALAELVVGDHRLDLLLLLIVERHADALERAHALHRVVQAPCRAGLPT